MSFKLGNGTRPPVDGQPMLLAFPYNWKGVGQRRLVTETHGVRCNTLVKFELARASFSMVSLGFVSDLAEFLGESG